ncbi:MAG TPA: hypothetical protein ENJ25_03970 [Firmicutes bacterium]|uniref:Uncharacterized protein n=1 Tax=candidate division TA06 bacterium TaxID=2250710 RepID=A0A660S7C3_UNCT6|nr:MAG: hypothetical protein DRP44_07635 [candidate division TA06 bacterium]HFD05276.1 hypothetical protein [Bacillota bacterium]
MKRRLPLIIVMLTGIGMIIQYFIPHPVSKAIYKQSIDWVIIISAFYLVLGVGGIFIINYQKIKRRKEGWWLSIITLSALIITALIGIFGGIDNKSVFMDIFMYIQLPMQAAMFSLLAFYIASAAFRSFRARTPEATVLLITATIVMLGRVPIGSLIYRGLPGITEWILSTVSLAAQRGILLGVGLGSIATSMKIILGIERSYLGGGE